jgi:uncharacterized RDD family membrane protein YckC
MERVQIQTAQNVRLDLEVAGLGDRVLAAIIDYAIVVAYFIGSFLVLASAKFLTTASLILVVFLPTFLYFLLCELFLDGQTVGKLARRIKVVRLDGRAPTVSGYLTRWLLRPIDFELTSGAAALACVLVTGTGQRLGDLAAGTTVVKIRPRTALRDTLFARLDEMHTPTFAQVDALADADVEVAKDVLNTLVTQPRSPATAALGRRTQRALARKMGVTSDLTPPHFLRAVIEDYNHHFGQR